MAADLQPATNALDIFLFWQILFKKKLQFNTFRYRA